MQQLVLKLITPKKLKRRTKCRKNQYIKFLKLRAKCVA